MAQPFHPTVELDGNAVRRIRESKRLTQLYVAKVVGVTTDTISRWENNRYPSIKRENLFSLAEALEVVPEMLVHNAGGDDEISEPAAATELPPRRRAFWLIPLALLVLFGVYRFLFAPSLTPFVEISARRALPIYAAPNAVIPVRIELTIDAPTGGFIVREHFPVGWKLIEASPPASSLDNVEGMARWILKVGESPAAISYLVRVAADAPVGGKGTFRGDVVLRRQKDKAPALITGAYETYVERYHWADVDGNSIIDDREVLEAFDEVEVMQDIHVDWERLSALWDEGKYRWDEAAGTFVSIRSTGDSGAASD